MKKIIFPFLFLALVCSAPINLFSQEYKTGMGLRGGWTSGLTFKQFIKEDRAIELIFSSGWRRWQGYQITALYEVHKGAFTKDEVKGFFWFYGGGAHFGGGYKYEHWHPTGTWTGYWHKHGYNSFGVDLVFGLEYKIEEVPITLGVDVKPFFEFATDPEASFGFWDSALSIRFVF